MTCGPENIGVGNCPHGRDACDGRWCRPMPIVVPTQIQPASSPDSENLEFDVFGESVSQGSLTAVPTNRNWRTVPGVRWTVKDAKPKLKPWRKKVADAAAVAFGERELLEGPVRVRVRFMFARPKSHFFVRKTGDVLRPDAPSYVTSHQEGDLDKHIRSILDALTGVVFKDDSQVVVVEAVKAYGTQSSTRVEVSQVQ